MLAADRVTRAAASPFRIIACSASASPCNCSLRIGKPSVTARSASARPASFLTPHQPACGTARSASASLWHSSLRIISQPYLPAVRARPGSSSLCVIPGPRLPQSASSPRRRALVGPPAGSGRPQRPQADRWLVFDPWAALRPLRRPQLVRAVAPAILTPAGT